jgi:TPR repeat protein
LGYLDVIGARALLERAATDNNPEALLALAETYDRTSLEKWGIFGMTGDEERAKSLYQRAAAQGSAEARRRLVGLGH